MTKTLFLIKNEIDISERIIDILSTIKTSLDLEKPFIIFNIKSIVFDNKEQLNKDIYCAVKYLIKDNNNILFVFCGLTKKLITKSIKQLNSYTLFKSIPKIYLLKTGDKKENTRRLIQEFYKHLSSSLNYKKKIYYIGCEDLQLENKKIKEHKYQIKNIKSGEIDNNKKGLYKFLKIKIRKKTKKQQIYNHILQNNIKKNISLFKKGKYKSKKQAIAIAYQETNTKC